MLASERTQLDQGPPLQQRIADNKRRLVALAFAFGAGVFVVFALLLTLISLGSFLPSLIVALAIAIVWVTVALKQGSAVVLDLCDAQDANPKDHARLFNVVNGLRAAMGLPALDLYIVDDPAMNALAVGSDPQNASLVVTTGLLQNTDLVELEAVVALQLYRIKTHDTAPETFLVPTFGFTSVLAEAADRYEGLARALRLPTPWVDAVVAKVHPASREIETDIEAMGFTRYPPALAAVLDKMVGRSAPVVATSVTAHLWAAPSLAPSAHPGAARTHVPLPERVAVLQEL